MLEIRNLHAEVDGAPILQGLSLTVEKGEVHALMGPNGSGKSTLAYILAGKDGYEITDGQILYQGEDLLEMSVDERALSGLFLAFQYPVEIPGVSALTFLKAALNARRKRQGEKEIDALGFLTLVRENLSLLSMSEDILKRSVNFGFSGGEKKRFEILQMALFNPQMAILDETDSGLDIDALKTVANGVNTLRHPQRSILLITHYQRLLKHIEPDRVHVLVNGRIQESGSKTLVDKLEDQGYAPYDDLSRTL